ncbi:hypothetical protein [Vibrio phage VCPH]|nr:hypothetical protein [Vibrio phage VCPH]
MTILKTAIATTGAVHVSSLGKLPVVTNAQRERFQTHMLNMALSIDSIGFHKLANLYTVEFENDMITEGQCRSLRFQLAMAYENLYGMEHAAKFMGVEKVTIDSDSAISADWNKQRLENNQCTQWVDNEIVNLPEPKLELRYYGV